MPRKPARLVLAVVDVAVAGTMAAAVAAVLAAAQVFRRSPPRRAEPSKRSMLTLENDYSLATIRERGLDHIVTIRDLDGFFDHVWSVNPVVGADRTEPAVGPPESTSISAAHTLIQGKVCYSRRLQAFPVSNFVLGQVVLLHRLDRLIRTEDIDLVRASEPFYSGLFGLLLARTNGRPFVVRLIANYDLDYWAEGRPIYPRLFRRRWVEKRIDRFILARADLVAAGNENILDYALNNGAAPGRTTVFLVGHLIDQIHFAEPPEARPGVGSELPFGDRPFLACVTRLVSEKHPDDVIAALAEARRAAPNLAAVLVGDGYMRAELEAQAAELGLTEDVFFAGNRKQIWIARLLASATVVVSPLSGRALVEAALSATPIVAYDIDWQREIVRNGETGILVRNGDVKELGSAAAQLVNDPTLARKLGTRAREVAMELMDPDTIVNHERGQYEKLLRQHAEGGVSARG